MLPERPYLAASERVTGVFGVDQLFDRRRASRVLVISNDAVGGKILTWRWMAYCAVHRDSAAAAALLRSAPSDPAEVAALRALHPALANCLPKEHWADLRAVAIRALVADALFQRLESTTR